MKWTAAHQKTQEMPIELAASSREIDCDKKFAALPETGAIVDFAGGCSIREGYGNGMGRHRNETALE